MKKLLLAIVIVFGPAIANSYCQTHDKLQEYFDEGQYFFNRGDFQDALYYYFQLLRADSTNANFNYKVGECYLNIAGKEHLAIPYFELAAKNTVPKKSYKKKSIEETAAPLHVLFYLGNAYRMNNELDKALQCYLKFIDSPFFYGNYNQNVVEKEIKTCERAKIIQDAKIDYDLINLGEAINSDFSEERPVISGDGNTLVFIRKLKFYDAIFCSRKVNDVWTQAVNINPEILSDGEYYPSGLDYTGKTLLLVKRDGDSYDIYTSGFDGEKWSNAVRMGGNINTLSEETHASFSPDNKCMLITSNRPGGKGGFDLYLSRQNSTGGWKKPTNLGKNINTDFDESSGYLTGNPDVLFFSSQGHYTMGGFDIFYSKKNDKKWDIPINIGYPINDTRDNLNYCPASNDVRTGYVSLIRDDGKGNADIYLLKIRSNSILNFSAPAD